jgi:hypothetical protein
VGVSAEHVSRTLASGSCGAGLVLCGFARSASAAAPLIPLEQFAADLAMSAPRISPDGSRVGDGEHSLWRPDMRLTLYGRLEALLAANLGQQ